MCSRFFYCHSGGGYLSLYFLAERQEIKGRQSSLGNISQMREIITPGGRLTRLREIPEFSIKLREAPAECGRVDSSRTF